MKFAKSSSVFYETSKSNIKSEQIEDAEENYKYQFDFGTFVDGYQYIIMIKDMDVSLLNPSSSSSYQPHMAKIIRMKDDKAEIVKEGVFYFGKDLKIPLKVSPDKISVPSEEPVPGTLEIYVSSSTSSGARCNTQLNGTVSGSVSAKKAFINASLTCKNTTSLNERSISLSLKPFDDKMAPASCQGKISDTMKLGKAKVVVEKIADDSSELVVGSS